MASFPRILGFRRPQSRSFVACLFGGLLVCGMAFRLNAKESSVPRDGFTPAQRGLWSLQPLARVAPPTLTGDLGRWARTPVDRFIAAQWAERGLSPSPSAPPAMLLRRVCLDLTGIPPTPLEVEAFEADPSPAAYARVVDKLLASPQYGERWARHWLDLARYAESEGFKADETRPNAWRYRDYVIRAFNADKPYDRFVCEQLAGDELWPDDADALIATGFNRHYPDESNARNLMQRRQEILNDITDTTGAVFCGLTFACARCHDHKWDPITQADYYRLQAHFANTAADDRVVLLRGPERERHAAALRRWEGATRGLREEMARLEEPHREAILRDYTDKYPDNIQVALRKPASERTAFEHQMVAKARLYLDPESHQYLAPSSACAGRMKGQEKARWTELKRQLDALASLNPGPMPVATGLAEVAEVAPATHVLKRGMWEAPLQEVEPGIPSVLDRSGTTPTWRADRNAAASPSDRNPPAVRGTGRRTQLARWIADPENPLTARVLVNRVWQQHFGRGLVGTSGDFGLKGDRPTHPELLDWLAREFMQQGWSLKALHRMIVLSATYQTDSRSGPDANRDGQDVWLSRFPRTRLEGEFIRDAALAVSGRLNLQSGGPSVFPALPPGMESRGGWPVSARQEARDRRSVYVFVRRNTRYPLFESFDMPDTHESCPRRGVTTSPVQALALLNSSVSQDWARSLAGRVLADRHPGESERNGIERLWRVAYARLPEPGEIDLALRFLRGQSERIEVRRARGEAVAVPEPVSPDISPALASAWVDLCHSLLNSNEFVYRF